MDKRIIIQIELNYTSGYVGWKNFMINKKNWLNYS